MTVAIRQAANAGGTSGVVASFPSGIDVTGDVKVTGAQIQQLQVVDL